MLMEKEREIPKRVGGRKEKKWVRTSVTRVPVEINLPREGQTKVVVDFPKKYPTVLQPVSFKVNEIKVKLGDPEDEMGEREERTETQIEMSSLRFPGSAFTMSVPNHFESRESAYLFLTLKKEREKVVVELLNGYLSADEWVLDSNGVSMSMHQLRQYQMLMLDDKKKLKPSEEEFLEMLEMDFE